LNVAGAVVELEGAADGVGETAAPEDAVRAGAVDAADDADAMAQVGGAAAPADAVGEVEE